MEQNTNNANTQLEDGSYTFPKNEKYKVFVLVGPPGVGKSTFIKTVQEGNSTAKPENWQECIKIGMDTKGETCDVRDFTQTTKNKKNVVIIDAPGLTGGKGTPTDVSERIVGQLKCRWKKINGVINVDNATGTRTNSTNQISSGLVEQMLEGSDFWKNNFFLLAQYNEVLDGSEKRAANQGIAAKSQLDGYHKEHFKLWQSQTNSKGLKKNIYYSKGQLDKDYNINTLEAIYDSAEDKKYEVKAVSDIDAAKQIMKAGGDYAGKKKFDEILNALDEFRANKKKENAKKGYYYWRIYGANWPRLMKTNETFYEKQSSFRVNPKLKEKSYGGFFVKLRDREISHSGYIKIPDTSYSADTWFYGFFNQDKGDFVNMYGENAYKEQHD